MTDGAQGERSTGWRRRLETLDLLSDEDLIALVQAEWSATVLDGKDTEPSHPRSRWGRDLIEWARQQVCEDPPVRAFVSDAFRSTVDDAVVLVPSLLALLGDDQLGLATAIALVLARRGLQSLCLE